MLLHRKLVPGWLVLRRALVRQDFALRRHFIIARQTPYDTNADGRRGMDELGSWYFNVMRVAVS
jgi:hypothetical protein